MPYLQFDLPRSYPAETKRQLARRVGQIYAEVMQTTPDIVKVAFRELGAENLFRCGRDEPGPVVVLMCDIRRGRPAAQRQAVASALAAAAAEALEVSLDQVEIEFTQHPGDEMYRHGALVADWLPAEGAAL
jgi:phenylpyruvate tautomerase PptA (4-oxalocrotonate tautomerase family)